MKGAPAQGEPRPSKPRRGCPHPPPSSAAVAPAAAVLGLRFDRLLLPPLHAADEDASEQIKEAIVARPSLHGGSVTEPHVSRSSQARLGGQLPPAGFRHTSDLRVGVLEVGAGCWGWPCMQRQRGLPAAAASRRCSRLWGAASARPPSSHHRASLRPSRYSTITLCWAAWEKGTYGSVKLCYNMLDDALYALKVRTSIFAGRAAGLRRRRRRAPPAEASPARRPSAARPPAPPPQVL